MSKGKRIFILLAFLCMCVSFCSCGRSRGSFIVIGKAGEITEGAESAGSGAEAGETAPEGDGANAGSGAVAGAGKAAGDGTAAGNGTMAGSGTVAGDGASAVSESGTPEVPETKAEAKLYVYVCGAVKEPGVVILDEGSRLEDALKAAGGFAENADRSYVNLAAPAVDGEKVYFPEEGESLPLDLEAKQESESAGSGLVNINTADAAALCTLPGIGETRAGDIIDYREKNGGFETKEDIMKVPVIKSGAYNKICYKFTVK